MGKKEEVKVLLKIVQDSLEGGSGFCDRAVDELTDKIHNIYAKDIEVMERVREYCEKLEIPDGNDIFISFCNGRNDAKQHILSILNSNSSGGIKK